MPQSEHRPEPLARVEHRGSEPNPISGLDATAIDLPRSCITAPRCSYARAASRWLAGAHYHGTGGARFTGGAHRASHFSRYSPGRRSPEPRRVETLQTDLPCQNLASIRSHEVGPRIASCSSALGHGRVDARLARGS